MSKTTSLICALITTFIWGTAFIAQDTGMDNIGPLTFNASRFFVGFLTVLPIALILERKKINYEINTNKKLFLKYIDDQIKINSPLEFFDFPEPQIIIKN